MLYCYLYFVSYFTNKFKDNMTYPGTLLKSSNIFAKKELGQNFLADSNIAQKIVNLARISKDDVVLEIGAGFGALTIHTAKQAAKVYAVEKDDRIIHLLKSELAAAQANNVELIQKDIFKVDIEDIARQESNISYNNSKENSEIEDSKNQTEKRRKIVVMGNLPYNISSQVLLRLVEKRAFISRAVLMFQKELAQRICAPAGGRDYGRLSAVMQYCSTIKTLTDVRANLFFPKPSIESTVIEVNFFSSDNATSSPYPTPTKKPYLLNNSTSDLKPVSTGFNLSYEQETFLFQVIKAAFSKRRKTLRNALTGSELEFNKYEIEKGLNIALIDPERRAETLQVREFIDLALSLWNIRAHTLS